MTWTLIRRLWPEFTVAVAVLMAGYFVRSYGANEYKRGQADVQAQWDADARKRTVAAANALAAQALEYQIQLEDAHAKHTQDLQTALQDARTAATAADGLRKQLATARHRIATAAKPAIAEYATATADVFEQCSGEYRALAEAADGHVADVRLMQRAWPVQTFSGALQ